MGLDFKRLEASLCNQLCEKIVFHTRDDGVTMLESPLAFPDGDQYPIYVEECSDGRMILSDRGHTLLHISYSHDIDSLYDGSRSAHREQIVRDNGIIDNDGVFSIESDQKDLARNLFKFGQGLTQIYDLAFVSQERTEQTFYFELERVLQSCINGSELQNDYIPSADPNSLYSVDYHVKSRTNKSVYVYGIHNSDKARLVTINLQHFQIEGLDFESLIVFENRQLVSRKDVARVSDVASNQIYSIERTPTIQKTLAGMLQA